MSEGDLVNLAFRDLREEDLDNVMDIELEAYPEAWSIGMFREEIRSTRSRFVVALLGERIVGYGGFWLVLDEAHITSVTVRDIYRGRGFGRQVLAHLLAIARAHSIRIATLEVRSSNRHAIGLYETMGFRTVGIRKGYYSKTNEDAIVMLKELT